MRIIVLLFFVLSYMSVKAQGFKANLSLGLTSSQISGDGAYGFVQFGVSAGGEVVYTINDDWSTSFGIRFNQKGSRIYKSKNSVDTYRLRVNYVEAPFLVSHTFDKLSVGLGPVMGIKINQKERTQYGEVDNPRIFDPFEIGFEFNLDYQLKDKWSIRLLYQNSILAVRDHPVDQAYPPALFVIGTFHQKMLNQGQYFTSLSLVLAYQL